MNKFYAFLAACLLSMSAAWAAGSKEVYTEFDVTTGTLTYYYDAQRTQREGITELYDPAVERFKGYAKAIKKAHIHASMEDAGHITSTKMMFFSGNYSQKLSNLTEITGMKNLYTHNVTDMTEMFYGCSALTSIDLLHLYTENVKVMDGMFQDCSSLEELDLSHFWTHNLEQMSSIFDGCTALKRVNMSSFRTENVMWMDGLFYNCKSLTEVDVANFDMSKAVTVTGMFYGCSNLKTIYCNTLWSQLNDVEGDDLFKGCTNLVGEYGTQYNANYPNLDYARPDIQNGTKGYFTTKNETYAIRSGNILGFVCGKFRSLIGNTMLLPIQIDQQTAKELQSSITQINFMDGFENSEITRASDLAMHTSNLSTSYFNSVTKITGLEHINTSVLTNWSGMFHGMLLKEIDLTKIDMTPITHVYGMFAYCSELETIYCNEDWNLRKDWKTLGTTDNTFFKCYKLKGGNGTVFDEEHIKIDYAHPDKAGNPGYFTATKILDPEAYAAFDEQIRTLTYYYDKNRAEYDATILLPWTDKDFYEAHKTDIGRILIDESFKNAPLKSSQGLFHYTSNGSYSGLPYVGEIDGLENLDTKTMTNLMWLFAGMEGMVEFDLTKMDLSDIIAAPGMFVYCSNLKKIICDADLSGIEDGYQMFYGCENLVGGLGTKCDGESIVSQAYARPDEEDNPGYFTSSKTGLKSIQHAGLGTQKVLRDGVLLIEKNGKLFNAQGAEVK